jgi:hypothetical protein
MSNTTLTRPTPLPTSVRRFVAKVGTYTGTPAGVGSYAGSPAVVGSYTGTHAGAFGSYVRSQR